jgi:GDP-L-fucose synthase
LKQHLTEAGIEHRPIISGNMVRQPFNALYDLPQQPQDFPGAEYVHRGGLFLGLHSAVLTAAQVKLVATTLRDFAWREQRRVLVTGGSGLLGHALQAQWSDDDEHLYSYVSSQDCDLCNPDQTLAMFRLFRPTHVVHAAARVGGLYLNMGDHMQMGVSNVQMNTAVLQAAEACNVQHLVAISSTCIYPSELTSFSEEDIHAGAPHDSNAEYALSKRLLHMQVEKVRRARGYPWQLLVPCNLYGPHDTFSPAGHVIGGLLAKACSAAPTLEVCGTGTARRQFMYVKDLARLIAQVLVAPTADLLCAPPGDISIAELAALVARVVGKEVTYDTSLPDGQLRKLGRTERFQQQFPDFAWTPLAVGLQETLDWYRHNNVRDG